MDVVGRGTTSEKSSKRCSSRMEGGLEVCRVFPGAEDSMGLAELDTHFEGGIVWRRGVKGRS